MNEDKFSYNKQVKERLTKWKKDFEEANKVVLNYSAIANALENHFNISTSVQKIAAMFNSEDEREVKLKELVAIMQIFDIPMWDICQYPNNPNSGINTCKLFSKWKEHDGTINELHNDYYYTECGQSYYCYYFRPKHFQNGIKPIEDLFIKEAKMFIFNQDGHTIIKIEEVYSETDSYGPPESVFTASGRLYHFKNTNMAYSFISDSVGQRVIALMFTYLDLSADIRYYMTVGMMTFSLSQRQEPLFQKMAVFRVKQNYHEEKTSEILRGILALNSSPLIINEETKKRLEQDDSMRKLLSEGKNSEKYYIYNETTLGKAFSQADDDKKCQMLLRLLKNSFYPAHEIVSESDLFSDFIKNYQQLQ